MKNHKVRVYRSEEGLAREEQLAWKLAETALNTTEVTEGVQKTIINRVIDNASVAMAAINRSAVANARSQALCHPWQGGATLFGMPQDTNVSPEWAAWANGTAVRELDYHDTFLAADYSHPADNIPPLLAVAQVKHCTGKDLIRAIAAAYEVQVALVKGICLHEYKIDHIAHLGPSVAAGLGTLLGLETETVFQAINQALHVTTTTRQSRKGEISSWKAYAPSFAGKMGVEAVDRAMRGEKSPAPIYEGEDGFIAWMLGGKDAAYEVPLPEKGEPRQAILETYTKEHSAEYQSQALIDLAFRMRDKINDFKQIESITIYTSHHTHYVIGSGSGDPQKYNPDASRETLDHSVMYIFAVALEDDDFHHTKSYQPERAKNPDTVELWKKIKTEEDPEWTRRYHESDPSKKAFGAKVVVQMKDGETISDEMAFANAHPYGQRPFERLNYITKFKTLTEGIIDSGESARFLNKVQNLPELDATDLYGLNISIDKADLKNSERDNRGIF